LAPKLFLWHAEGKKYLVNWRTGADASDQGDQNFHHLPDFSKVGIFDNYTYVIYHKCPPLKIA
jgi:hypothetical protein